MPLFEIDDEQLVPFRRVQAGPELYESEIEDLMWADLEAFMGEALFPVRRQATIGDGLKPDIIALDRDGHVVVIEIKRDIERKQLAQCLEYAGWARSANLDELAGLYPDGESEFFGAWMEFTDTPSPMIIQRPPRVVLVARDFDSRTDGALGYLTDSDLPITVLRVTVYADQEQRRFIDIESDHEPELAAEEETASRKRPNQYMLDGKRVEVSDLIDASLVNPGDSLIWERPRLGATYRATILDSGQIRLEDGRVMPSLSRAAIEAAGVPAYDGWLAWCVVDGRAMRDIRDELLSHQD